MLARKGLISPWMTSGGLLVFVMLVSASSTKGQNPPALQITAPGNNTIFNPGQTISITVTSPNSTAAQAFVIGETPVGATAMASSFPAQLSLTIPQEIALGKYLLTAMGKTSSGQTIFSAGVAIDVERPDMPTGLKADPNRLFFEAPGQTDHLRVLATFLDGSILDAQRSINITLASSNTSIVTVDQNANIKAVAQGNATITATYTLTDAQGTHTLSVSVPITIPPPTTTPSPSSLNFNPKAVETSSPPQNLGDHERDCLGSPF